MTFMNDLRKYGRKILGVVGGALILNGCTAERYGVNDEIDFSAGTPILVDGYIIGTCGKLNNDPFDDFIIKTEVGKIVIMSKSVKGPNGSELKGYGTKFIPNGPGETEYWLISPEAKPDSSNQNMPDL